MKQTICKTYYKTSILLCEAIRKFFGDSFNVNHLEEFHKNTSLGLLETGTDQTTPFHKAIYKEFDKDTDSPLSTGCFAWNG